MHQERTERFYAFRIQMPQWTSKARLAFLSPLSVRKILAKAEQLEVFTGSQTDVLLCFTTSGSPKRRRKDYSVLKMGDIEPKVTVIQAVWLLRSVLSFKADYYRYNKTSILQTC